MATRTSFALAALPLFAWACGPAADVPDLSLSQVHQEQREHQGTRLLGGEAENTFVVLPAPFTAPALRAYDGSGRPLETVRITYGHIKAKSGGATLWGRDLAGATFAGQDTLTGALLRFKINSVTPVAGTLDRYGYEVYVSGRGAGDRPLCSGGELATPVPGAWTAAGDFRGASGEFSFACPDGVVLKCIDWGYPLWEPAMADYHQACTRMARADYCGTGESHTVDGTPIDHYDLPGVEGVSGFVPPSSTATGMVLEAAWAAKGPVVCLSKLRWSTLPLGGHCPGTLPDPRTVDIKKDPRALFCEDYGKGDVLSMLRDLEAAGAFTFNDSAFMDAGLYRWVHGSTNESLTSSEGLYAPVRADGTSPAPGYTHAVFEGAVFNPTLPSSARPAGVLELTRYFSPSRNDYLTTTAKPDDLYGTSTDYVQQRVEGFIYPPSPSLPTPTARPLRLYYSFAHGDFVTTTSVLPWPMFWLMRDEGYLPR